MPLNPLLLTLAPELFIAICAMVLLLVGVFLKGAPAREITLAAVAVLLMAIIIDELSPVPTVSMATFTADGLARLSKVFIFAGAIIALLMSNGYLTREGLARFEFPILVLLSTIGMGIMVSATDLISMYMGIELQSLALYIMAAFNRDSRRSTEAGLKYFVLGALSSGLLLYGASLVYGFTGSTNFAAIAQVAAQVENPVGLTFGLVFVMTGLAFKVSAAPFHMWTPDVYEGSPTPVTAFFAAAPKFAGMILFGRLLLSAFPSLIDQWQPVLMLIAASSMIVGAFSALVQTNIKRLMAYSSVGHMGYALMGLTVGTAQGVQGTLVYMVIYMVMTLGTFACILLMRRPEGMAENISDLSGLSDSQPLMAVLFTTLLFSLAGIPPLVGFWGKFYVFNAAMAEGLYVLAIIGVLTSVVAAFYYLSVIKTIWFDAPAPEFARQATSVESLTAVGAALALTVGTLVVMAPLNRVADNAVSVLFPKEISASGASGEGTPHQQGALTATAASGALPSRAIPANDIAPSAARSN